LQEKTSSILAKTF